MIYEFKSRATGTVAMTQSAAEWILQVIGKQAGPTGIITVAQMPDAIAALRKATEEERQAIREARRKAAGDDADDAKDDDDEEDPAGSITFGQRAFPFIEMLEQAHKAQRDVTWGV